MGAPSNRTATLESQMIPMIQDVPGQTLKAKGPLKTLARVRWGEDNNRITLVWRPGWLICCRDRGYQKGN